MDEIQDQLEPWETMMDTRVSRWPGYGDVYLTAHLRPEHARDIESLRHFLNSAYDDSYALHTIYPCHIERGCVTMILQKFESYES